MFYASANSLDAPSPLGESSLSRGDQNPSSPRTASEPVTIRMPIRFPTLEQDSWCLKSAEAQHAAHPDTFWIPPLADRQSVARGRMAKLLFAVRAALKDGRPDDGVHRMWVVVAEKVGDTYIGILDVEPFFAESFYLQPGVEVPFKAEHIIDIDDLPADYAEKVVSRTPTARWPRRKRGWLSKLLSPTLD